MFREYLTITIIITLILHQSNGLYNYPPNIIKSPRFNELHFKIGEPLIIDCEAESNPESKFYWTKDNKPFYFNETTTRISQLQGHGTLIVKHLIESDEGEYQCYAENSLGIARTDKAILKETILLDFKYTNISVSVNLM